MTIRTWLAFLTLGLMSLTASAQWFVMANASYGTYTYTYTKQGQSAYFGLDGVAEPKGNTFQVGANFGYTFLKGKLSPALSVNYGRDNNEYKYGSNNNESGYWQLLRTEQVQGNSLSITPSVSYLVLHKGRFYLYAMLYGRWTMGKGVRNVDEPKANQTGSVVAKHDTQHRDWAIGVLPYIDIMITDHLYAEFTFNLLSLGYAKHKETSLLPDSNGVDEVLETSGFELGINSMNTTMVGIGFGYSF